MQLGSLCSNPPSTDKHRERANASVRFYSPPVFGSLFDIQHARRICFPLSLLTLANIISFPLWHCFVMFRSLRKTDSLCFSQLSAAHLQSRTKRHRSGLQKVPTPNLLENAFQPSKGDFSGRPVEPDVSCGHTKLQTSSISAGTEPPWLSPCPSLYGRREVEGKAKRFEEPEL